MNIIVGQPPAMPQGSAVTIGNFDGVHQGHLYILQMLKQKATALGLSATAIIFEPQPAEYFARMRGIPQPFRLTPLRDKLQRLQATHCLDTVWIQRFNQEFAQRSPEQFITETLCGHLNTQYLLIGDDFRFGKGRAGDFHLLKQQQSFITEKTDSILVSGCRASSTSVRECLSQGDLHMAQSILGYPYTLSGRVKHGQKLGRTLDCPTANVHLPNHHYALRGVFVVQVQGAFGRRGGVASLGVNPTVSDTLVPKLEVHLFDYYGDLYGQRIEVQFLHKLRDEMKFDSLASLRWHIAQDMAAARDYLANHQNLE